MRYWNNHFSQYQTLNWLMVWLFLSCTAILWFPLAKLGPAAESWLQQGNIYFWLGILIASSYFVSQGMLIALDYVCRFWNGQQRKQRLETMVQCLDFSERAVLREFILQRKSVIKLPVTEPAVKNLLEAGVLVYAYAQPFEEDDLLHRELMIALPARPLITYKLLGLTRGKLSDEQIEQIKSDRPKFALKSLHR